MSAARSNVRKKEGVNITSSPKDDEKAMTLIFLYNDRKFNL